MGEKELLPYRKKMQSVFQDPYSSLDPSHTVQDIICEPMEIHKLYTPKERKERAKELIRVVGLKEQDLLKYPHEFSGGQRQRLTLARALVPQSDILIMDDSASALDYATDARLRKAIQDMKRKPTVFIVSQRTSSIQNADMILVLDDGKIAGQGTHEQLLKSCNIYREIYETQFKKEEA